MIAVYVNMIEKGTTSTGKIVNFTIVCNLIRKKYNSEIADNLIKQIKSKIINDGYGDLLKK